MLDIGTALELPRPSPGSCMLTGMPRATSGGANIPCTLQAPRSELSC